MTMLAPHFERLEWAVSHARQAIRSAEEAEHRASTVRHECERMKVQREDNYSTRSDLQPHQIAVRDAMTTARDAETINQADMAARSAVADAAMQIDLLRAQIPFLVTPAVAELGGIAGGCRYALGSEIR